MIKPTLGTDGRKTAPEARVCGRIKPAGPENQKT